MTETAKTTSRSGVLKRARSTAALALRRSEQARFGFKPLDAVVRAQQARLRTAVAHAYETVPYYRETMRRLGAEPAEFRTVADLARLPVIERHDLQRDPEYFVSGAAPLDTYLQLMSGGSTGAPRRVYHNGSAMLAGAAHFERIRSVMSKVAGKRFGFREAVIVPPFSTFQLGDEFREKKQLVRSGLLSRRLYLSLLDPVEENLERLNEFGPDILQGYGSYLELLFQYVYATGSQFHRPRVVVFYADAMSDSARRIATDVLGIPVLSVYGAIEAFHIGFECEENTGYHLNLDLVPLRILSADGREAVAGQSGDVIVSNLVNRATVLLNYRLGDVASLLPFRCPCGRTLPLLSFIEGRTDDWIEGPSGEILHPQTIRTLFTDEEEIWQFQVEQKTPTDYRVRVVAADSADREAMTRRLAQKFVGRLGTGTRIETEFVASVPRSSGGKVRSVVSLDRARAFERVTRS
jgi:phenylacetate-CoA ligase